MKRGGDGETRRLTPTRGDLVAGTAVGLVLVPQAIAYAQLAGLPPSAGIAAAVAGALVAGLLASYPLLQTGPTALTAALTLGALGGAVGTGSAEPVAVAALLALIVGVLRVALGVLGLGGVAYLVSEPVLVGLLPGIAFAIAGTQVAALTGAPRPDAERTVVAAAEVLGHPGRWDGATLAIGLGALVALVLARRIDARIPAAAGVAVLAIALAALVGYDGRTVGDVALALPTLPTDLPWDVAPSLLVGAFVIALVGFVEPTTIVRSREEDAALWDPDRELVAQGAANVACAVVGGMPVGGSFSRTALAREAGGATRASGLVAGLAVLASLPAAPLLARMPVAVPAAVILVAVLALVRAEQIRLLRRASRVQFGVALGTFAVTVALAPRIDLAVGAGIALAVLVHLWRETRVPVLVERSGTTLALRPQGVLWFASAHRFERAARLAIASHLDARLLRIDLAALGRIDVTGVRAVARVMRAARGEGMAVEVVGVPSVTGGMVARVLAEEGVEP